MILVYGPDWYKARQKKRKNASACQPDDSASGSNENTQNYTTANFEYLEKYCQLGYVNGNLSLYMPDGTLIPTQGLSILDVANEDSAFKLCKVGFLLNDVVVTNQAQSGKVNYQLLIEKGWLLLYTPDGIKIPKQLDCSVCQNFSDNTVASVYISLYAYGYDIATPKIGLNSNFAAYGQPDAEGDVFMPGCFSAEDQLQASRNPEIAAPKHIVDILTERPQSRSIGFQEHYKQPGKPKTAVNLLTPLPEETGNEAILQNLMIGDWSGFLGQSTEPDRTTPDAPTASTSEDTVSSSWNSTTNDEGPKESNVDGGGGDFGGGGAGDEY